MIFLGCECDSRQKPENAINNNPSDRKIHKGFSHKEHFYELRISNNAR